MVISIEALSKPDNANKIQELEAMEQALAKAAEEAHKQKLNILGTGGTSAQLSQNSSPALMELKQKQEAQ